MSELKEIISEEIKLAYPDYREGAEPLELHVDASGYGAGACLAQWQNGQHKVIAYASMSFSPTQQKYSTTDREITALRWGVKTFRAFLYGVHFIIYTDHRPILYLHNMKMVESRLARTVEDLAEFSFTIKYCPGVDHTVPDALSRLPQVVDEAEDKFVDGWLPRGLALIKKVEGGGNSLFESLIQVRNYDLGREGEMSLENLRRTLVEELLQNPKIYGLELNRAQKKELKAMKFAGQLPSMDLIMVFAKMYKYQVWVHVGTDQPIIFDYNKGQGLSDCSRLHLQLLGGIHFNPVIEGKNYAPPKMDLLKNRWKQLPEEQKEENVFVNNFREEEMGMQTLFEDGIDKNITRPQSCICQHRNGPFTTMATLRGNQLCVVVDSGAEISLLSREVWLKLQKLDPSLKLDMEDSYLPVQGFGGSSNKILGVTNLNFKLDDGTFHSVSIPLAVLGDADPSCCLLLGQNFIAKYGIVIDFQRCELKRNKDGKEIRIHDFMMPENWLGPSWVQACPLLTCQNTQKETDTEDDVSEKENVDKEKQYMRVPHIIKYKDIVELQKRDFKLRKLKRIILSPLTKRGNLPKPVYNFGKHLTSISFERNCLWHHTRRRTCPVMPFKTLAEVVVDTHNKMAHIGSHKLRELISTEYWHPDLEKMCHDVATSCGWCQKNKPQPKKTLPPMKKIQTTYPFELVAMDLTEFPRSKSGKTCCLMVTDHYSKWVVAVPLPNKKGTTVATAFEQKVLPTLVRKPTTILSDNGPEFRCEEFTSMLASYNINHVFTTPYKPSSNGAVERVNRTIAQILKGLLEYGKDWEKELARAIIIHNTTYHDTIRTTPSEKLMVESHPKMINAILPGRKTTVWKKGDPAFLPFAKGTKVLKVIERPAKLNIHKFQPKFFGPLTVIKVNPNKVTYELKTEQGKIVRAHHSQLREWRLPPFYLRKLGNFEAVQYQDKNSKDDKRVKENKNVLPENCGMYLSSDELTTTISEWSSDDETIKASKISMRCQNYKQERKFKEKTPFCDLQTRDMYGETESTATSYAQNFSSSEFDEMRIISDTVNTYREELERWRPSLQKDSINDYRNLAREQGNSDRSQVSIQLIDFESEEISGENLSTPILHSSNQLDNRQNTIENYDQATVLTAKGATMTKIQEDPIQKTLLKETTIESQDHNEMTAESELPRSLFGEMVGDLKTQIMNIMDRRTVTQVPRENSSSHSFEGFENSCEVIENKRISVPRENSMTRAMTRIRSKAPRLESTRRTEDELEMQDSNQEDELNNEFMNSLKESNDSEIITSVYDPIAEANNDVFTDLTQWHQIENWEMSSIMDASSEEMNQTPIPIESSQNSKTPKSPTIMGVENILQSLEELVEESLGHRNTLNKVESILENVTEVVEESLSIESALSKNSPSVPNEEEQIKESDDILELSSRVSPIIKNNLAPNGGRTPITVRRIISPGSIRRRETLDGIRRQLAEARALIKENCLKRRRRGETAQTSEEIQLIKEIPEKKQRLENSMGTTAVTTAPIQIEPSNDNTDLYTIHTRSRGKAMELIHVPDKPIEYKARGPKKKNQNESSNV